MRRRYRRSWPGRHVLPAFAEVPLPQAVHRDAAPSRIFQNQQASRQRPRCDHRGNPAAQDRRASRVYFMIHLRAASDRRSSKCNSTPTRADDPLPPCRIPAGSTRGGRYLRNGQFFCNSWCFGALPRRSPRPATTARCAVEESSHPRSLLLDRPLLLRLADDRLGVGRASARAPRRASPYRARRSR